jgi:hypothetical protein
VSLGTRRGGDDGRVPSATEERRRIAIVDGADRWDLALPLSTRIEAVLPRIGIDLAPGAQVLVESTGFEVALERVAESFGDGEVLAVVDLRERVPAPRRRPAAPTLRGDPGATAAFWMLGAAGGLAAVLALLLPSVLTAELRVGAAVVLGIGAVATAIVWARRASGDAAPALAPVLLAFAAGVCAIPVLPAATDETAVLTGLIAGAVVAGLLAVAARTGAVRAGVATGSALLLGLAVVWGLALLVGLPPAAAPAIALGAVPLALRALPSTLLDVAPGMFIDYARFQRTRWSVRQQLPEPGGRVTLPAVRRLVDESSSRLLVGTAVLCGAAALSAPAAVPAFASDGIVLGGQIGVLACSSLALLFGARRFSSPALHWMPRIAALAVLGTVAAALTRLGDGAWAVVAAAVLLLGGLVAGILAVPVARGARSLSWSRFADLLEWLAVALALPAGLLAAGVIDLMRGMMAG